MKPPRRLFPLDRLVERPPPRVPRRPPPPDRIVTTVTRDLGLGCQVQERGVFVVPDPGALPF